MNNEEIERRTRLYWSVSYLLTFALWMWNFWPEMSTFSNIVGTGILSVIAAAFTYWFVGIALAILLIPFRILVNTVRDAFSSKSKDDSGSSD
ncbi:MAG: hypothetical protein K2W95_15205 [Candidatus Obscuribacterales bacterium]|nr:hypothetical protein [Candidatus Obscuribacterales bacterium]